MPKIIPPEVINDIQDRCDIVELISSYIPLKKAGRNFKALCPFHNEKTPSFIISPEKQIYHCFGCQEGGNALNFLMKYEHMDFKEAMETLAKKVGIVIQFQEKETEKEKSYINELYRINEIACDFYQNFLFKNTDSILKKYLESRNLKIDTLKKFKIGLAPNQWDVLMNYLRSKSINLNFIEKTGLLVAKEGGGFYDRFRNRLTIPIFDIKNRVIAFGARALDDSQPKYINSPETQIYIKGKNLFGLNLAKDSIREKDYCIIVEGYFDVITPIQEGLFNIVASSGTALTVEQIRLLKRYTKNVVVVFDADTAGQLATLRSLELFLDEEMNVKVSQLPKGHDPDLFVRKFGIENFKNLIDNALEIFDYKLNVLFGIYDVTKISQKTKIALEMLSMIKRIKNEILKSEYIKLLAEKISIDEKYLIRELNKIKINQIDYSLSNNDIEKDRKYPYPKVEKMLIKLILDDIELIKNLRKVIEPNDLQDRRLQKILGLVFNLYDSYKQIKPNQIINYLDDEDSISLVSELANEETLSFDIKKRDSIFNDCIKRIKSNTINLRCQDLHSKIKEAQSEGDAQSLKKLMEEFNLLIKERGKNNEKVRN